MSKHGGRRSRNGPDSTDQKRDDGITLSDCSTPSCTKMWQSPSMQRPESGRTLYKSKERNDSRRDSLVVGKLPDGKDCPNCLKNVNRVRSLEEVAKLKDTHRQEVESDFELTKSEIKDLRRILDDCKMQGKQDIRLAQAVSTFHREDDDSDLDEQDIKDMLEGKEFKRKGKKKKKEDDNNQLTYFDPEVVVLDELDMALAEVADLQGQVKQFENLNKALQERYREAEVKNALSQFKIQKLEKVLRAMELEKAERETAKANAKLEASKRESEEGAELYRSDSVYGMLGMTDLDAEKRLLGAAQNGDMATIKVLCDQIDAQIAAGKAPTKKLINCRNRDGWTPLMLASARGNLPATQKLISAGADYKLTETDLGYTALHLAAWNNRPQIVTYLCGEVGCPVDPEGENWRTPLMLAANWGAVKSLKALLAFGAEPSRADIRGKTAITWTRDENIKKLLIEADEKLKKKKKEQEDDDDIDDD